MPVHVLQNAVKLALCNGRWKGILKKIGSIDRGHQGLSIAFHNNEIGYYLGATSVPCSGLNWYYFHGRFSNFE